MARYTYVISDLHGQFDALIKLLDKIEFGYDDELYILGDVIDRGPKSLECVKWIMEQDNILTLLGNHELLSWTTTFMILQVSMIQLQKPEKLYLRMK